MAWRATFVRCAKCDKDGERPVVYEIEVTMDEQQHRVYRRYNEFFTTHMNLMKLFPVEAGEAGQPRTIPYMPGKVLLLPGQRKMQLAQQRIPQFNQYLKELLAMDERISRNKLVRQILSRQQDDDIFEPQFHTEMKKLKSDDSSDSSDDSSDDDDDGQGRKSSKKKKKKKKKSKSKSALKSMTKLAGSLLGSSSEPFVADPSATAVSPTSTAPMINVDTAQASKQLGSGRAVVLFSADGNDNDSGWQGAKLKARARDPNQYQAFNLPWSKTSKMKLGNIFFCELMMVIAEDMVSRSRSDVFNTYEPCVSGLALAEYLVGNVEGMDGVQEAFPVVQEMINLGAMRAINTAKFEPTSNSFYYFMFTHTNLRTALGTIAHKQQLIGAQRTAELDELEQKKQQVLTCLKYLGDRFGYRDASPLPMVGHKYRSFTHTMLVACDVCDGTMGGKLGFKCENCGINVHETCSRITNRGFAREYCFYPPPLPAPIVSGEFARELATSRPWSNRYIPRDNDGSAATLNVAASLRSRPSDGDMADDAFAAIRDMQSKSKGSALVSASTVSAPAPRAIPPPTLPTLTAARAPAPVEDSEWGEWDVDAHMASAATAPPPARSTPAPALGSTSRVAPPPVSAMTSTPPAQRAAIAPPTLPSVTRQPSTRASTGPGLALPPLAPAAAPARAASVNLSAVRPANGSGSSLSVRAGASPSVPIPPPSLPSLAKPPAALALTLPSRTANGTPPPISTTPPPPSPPSRATPAASTPSAVAAAPPSLPSRASNGLPTTSMPPPLLPSRVASSLPTTSMPPPSLPSRSQPAPAAAPSLPSRTPAATPPPSLPTRTTTTSAQTMPAPSLPSRGTPAPASTQAARLATSPPAVRAAPAVRAGARLLPRDFAGDRAARLGRPDVKPEEREAYYQALIDAAEAAGQMGLATAVFKVRRGPRRGTEEVRDLDRLLSQFASALDA